MLERLFEEYHAAVNFVIKEILTKHITTPSRTIEITQDEFYKRFDPRPEYLQDVVKTARVEIGRHRRMSKTVRSLRGKRPYFKPGQMILSNPIVSLGEKALVLISAKEEELPIPFDKRSRNRVIDILQKLSRDPKMYGRIRLTWRKAGYADIDIRYVRK
ncbi:MAG: hypothetical protein JSW61_13130 [Candidatus Thorarchaeota archaeon]|nr:MAG: hypothetical protein JSW61_13130 [Candidatus Thorarchaeota archaeon]